MKKIFLVVTLLWSVFVTIPAAWGAKLTAAQALERLASAGVGYYAPGRAADNLNLTATVGNLYVFSGERGYVVLPNDDAAPAVLGYSEQCDFDAESNSNLAYWLDCLSSEIDYISGKPQAERTAVARAVRASIEPMLNTQWSQGSPYNNDCPKDSEGKRCVTGCVATAMAQVLKYHNYPVKGTGTQSYEWNGQTLSFDYENTTFDWDAMNDVYNSSSSEASQAAVAQLMYACGVSVKMNYGADASGAPSQNIAGALINNFNYDKGLWLAQRNAYGIEEWEDLIYKELSENRPVIYGGYGSDGGHEFVCDGYREDGYFHFNWGWGGLSDGYFLLTALDPVSLGTGGGAGGYNLEQDALIGVRSAKEGSQPTYVIYNYEADFGVETSTASLGTAVVFTGDFLNCGAETIPSFIMGIGLQRDGDTEVRYVQSQGSMADFKPYYYFDKFSVTLPDDLADGDYVVTPAYKVDGQEWQMMRSMLTVSGSLDATVDGGTVTFTQPEKATVKVSDITTAGEIYIDKSSTLSFIISNPGTKEFLGEITPWLLNSDGTPVANAETLPVDLLGGTSNSYEETALTFTPAKGVDIIPGMYSLVFRDGADNNVSEPIEVKVKYANSEINVTGFSLLSQSPFEKSSVKFSLGVECTSGYFSDPLTIKIFSYGTDGVKEVYSCDTPVYLLKAGASETKTLDLDLSDLDTGKYYASVYDNGLSASSIQVGFDLKDQVGTGLDEIGVETDREETIFDLYGRRHSRPLIRGIYVINGVKTFVE